MKFQAAIFDLDGTLLDTLEDLADSMNTVLAANRLPGHPLSAYRHFVGDGIEMLVRRALPFEVADPQVLNRLVGEMKREYSGRWACKTQPYPGIPEMLDDLGRSGLALAVLSNKPDESAQVVLRHFFPASPFRIVFGSTAGRPKKPDPAAALEIAGRLGVPPARIVFLGDSGVDMRAARAAGMFPLGALWGFRGVEELQAAGAGRLAAEPREAAAFILGALPY